MFEQTQMNLFDGNENCIKKVFLLIKIEGNMCRFHCSSIFHLMKFVNILQMKNYERILEMSLRVNVITSLILLFLS